MNWDRKNCLSEFAKLILELSKMELDCMTSRVDLPDPDSYSLVMPSYAISAALTWDLMDCKKLLDDWKLDQALATAASADLLASSYNNSFWRFVAKNQN